MLHASISENRPSAHSRRRLVIPAWEDTTFTSYALGGKGHGIARLMSLRLPTPPALVISTSLARSYQETGLLPKRLEAQLERELKALEMKTGKRFGDPLRPLLVSVRSGAMISMPGMMETVLNVGLTKDVARELRARFGNQFVADCQRHLQTGLNLKRGFLGFSYGSAKEQLMSAITRVLDSWQSSRAQAYRREHGISDQLGTAITIQAMVFGNQSSSGESGTGVAMSHHPDTAESMLFGNYLSCAQGHDLVSGEMTPEPIEVLTNARPDFAKQLKDALALLQTEVGGPVEVEFTVESGTLYFLQFRRAKLSPEATIINLVRQKHAGAISREAVVAAVPEWMAAAVAGGTVLSKAVSQKVAYRGTGVGSNAAAGFIATNSQEATFFREKGMKYLLVRESTTPDDFELMLGAAGIITKEGGSTCHAAMVARHQGIPAVIGLGEDDFKRLSFDYSRGRGVASSLTLDAKSGEVFWGIQALVEPTFGKEVALFNKWRCLSQPVIDPTLCQKRFATNTALNNFYMAEAMLADCSDQALAAKIRAIHSKLTLETGAVFSTYLVLAVASEVTYADQRQRDLSAATQQAFTKLRERFTLNHRDKWCGLIAPEIAIELAAATPDDVANFFCVCKEVFGGSGWGGSIGGKAWADIAAVGEQYWRGEINTVTFIDRVFDLRHNTGAVFNKHSMVSSEYSSSNLDKQLETKRRNLPVFKKWEELMYEHRDIDAELLQLLQTGHKKGLWK